MTTDLSKSTSRVNGLLWDTVSRPLVYVDVGSVDVRQKAMVEQSCLPCGSPEAGVIGEEGPSIEKMAP